MKMKIKIKIKIKIKNEIKKKEIKKSDLKFIKIGRKSNLSMKKKFQFEVSSKNDLPILSNFRFVDK